MSSRKPAERAFWNVDESLRPYARDKELRRQVEGQYTGIIKFMSDNGLFKKRRRAVDEKGRLLIRQVFASDVTEEGIAFVKAAYRPWLRSKASAKDPSNTALLQKYLKKTRGSSPRAAGDAT